MADISTLVDDIHALFDNGAALDGVPLGDVIADVIKSRFAAYSTSREPTLRMSNIGRPPRQLWYELSGTEPDRPLTATAKIKFLYGDLLEALLLYLAEAAGHKVELRQHEISLNGIVGHIDAIIDDYLVDAKSAASISFLKFKTGTIIEDDPFGYIFQLSGYWQALRKSGVLLHGAGFLAIDKQFGHICFCPIENGVLDNMDVEGRISADRDIQGLESPPDELCYPDVEEQRNGKPTGNVRVSTGCSYCSFLHRCRPDVRTFLYSTGPKHYVKVASSFKVPEITQEFPSKE